MIHNIPFDIQPFAVPRRIVATPVRPKTASPVDEGKLVIPLSELDYKTLDALCNEFRESVFTSAGVKDMAKAQIRSDGTKYPPPPVFHGGGRD